MIEYIFIGVLLFFLSLLYHRHLITDHNALLFFIIAFLSIFIIGCRYNIGTDWSNYVDYYYSGIAVDKADGKNEFIFQLIRNIFSYLGFTHAYFFAVLSFFSLTVLIIASKNFGVRNIYLVFLVYYCLVFCNYQFNIVRHGLLTSCVMLSYSYKAIDKNKFAFIWALIGCGFHSVGFLFLLLLFIIDSKLKRKYVCLLLGLSFVFYLLGIGQKIISAIPFLGLIDRLAGYTDLDQRGEDGYGISIGLLFNIGLFIYLYFFKQKELYWKSSKVRILLNCLLLGIICSLTLNVFGAIVSRISNLFNTSLIFIWPLLFQELRNRLPKYILGIFFLTYLYLFFQRSIQENPITHTSDMYPYQMRVEQLVRRL